MKGAKSDRCRAEEGARAHHLQSHKKSPRPRDGTVSEICNISHRLVANSFETARANTAMPDPVYPVSGTLLGNCQAR